jgi:hypothetical protein
MKLIAPVAISMMSLLLVLSGAANAATAWFFDGQCYDSRVKWGTMDEDLGTESGDPIHCDKAVLLVLKNGRNLVNFSTGRGVLGFAGGGIDRQSHPTITLLPVDRIYPIRDLQGMTSKEAIESGANREGALDGAEGFCFFGTKQFETSKELSCVSKYEVGNKKTVYSIKMKVRKVTKNANFSEP